MNTSELTGGLLDYWVAMAGEIWKTAHKMYPTMTLDSTFKGVEIIGGHCILVPNNPFRQDPQRYQPSMDWMDGGQIVEKIIATGMTIQRYNDSIICCNHWPEPPVAFGEDVLTCVCRTFVFMKYGAEVSDL